MPKLPYYTQAYLDSKLTVAIKALSCKAASLAAQWRFGSINMIDQKKLEICYAQVECAKTFSILEKSATAISRVTADGATDVDSTILVNSVTISDSFLYGTTAATTATAIAAAINSLTSVPDYTATSLGTEITITAVTEGSTPNGLAITESGGDVTIVSEYFHSGQDGVTANNITEDELDFIFDNIASFTGCCYMSTLNASLPITAPNIIVTLNSGPSMQLNTLSFIELNSLQFIDIQ